jgi:hypothetical protein
MTSEEALKAFVKALNSLKRAREQGGSDKLRARRRAKVKERASILLKAVDAENPRARPKGGKRKKLSAQQWAQKQYNTGWRILGTSASKMGPGDYALAKVPVRVPPQYLQKNAMWRQLVSVPRWARLAAEHGQEVLRRAATDRAFRNSLEATARLQGNAAAV